MKRDRNALMTMLILDTTLVLLMFLGLLRLRGRGGSFLSLGRLLWKQVRWQQFFQAVVLSIL